MVLIHRETVIEYDGKLQANVSSNSRTIYFANAKMRNCTHKI